MAFGLSLAGALSAQATVPSPVISSPSSGLVTTHPSLTLGGTIAAGHDVSIQVADTVAGGSGLFCTVFVPAAASSWSCSGTLSTGKNTLVAIATNESYTDSETGLPGPAIVVTLDAPSAPALQTLASWPVDFGWTGGDTLVPGQTVDITGTAEPGASVDAVIHSTPTELGATTAGDDGMFELSATIPSRIELGQHTFVMTVTSPDGNPVTVAKTVTVRAAGGVVVTTTYPKKVHAASGGTAAEDRNAPASPSIVSSGLPTVQDLIRSPALIGIAVASGIILLLLVAFPAELLKAAISENYERLFGRLRRVNIRVHWVLRLKEFLGRTPVMGALLITVVTALVLGFADPHFGFDLESVRLVLACGIGLFIVGYVSNALTGAIVSRLWQVTTRIEIRPLGLIVTILGVLVSRVLDFSPGFLIGLVLGLTLTGETTLKQRSRAVLIRSGIVVAFGIIAWAAFSIAAAGGEPESFGAALAQDSLAAVVTEGFTALVVVLLPFRFLDGMEVFEDSRRLWALVYSGALIAFCGLVLPLEEIWTYLGGSFWIWLVIVAAFGAFCIGTYVVFRSRSPKDVGAEKEREESSIGQ
jgi:hypothetical protein